MTNECRRCGACCRSLIVGSRPTGRPSRTENCRGLRSACPLPDACVVDEDEQPVGEDPWNGCVAILSPRRDQDGQLAGCAFLDATNRCTIYPTRPNVCVAFAPAASSAGRHEATWKHKPRAGSHSRGKKKSDACRPQRAAGGRHFCLAVGSDQSIPCASVYANQSPVGTARPQLATPRYQAQGPLRYLQFGNPSGRPCSRGSRHPGTTRRASRNR